MAHRVAFEQAWGTTIPGGMVVRHTCDNPPCVNPMHLQLGTQADNVRDMHVRGRYAGGPVAYSDEVVAEFRSRVAAGEPQERVRKDYGISSAHASRLVNRKRRA